MGETEKIVTVCKAYVVNSVMEAPGAECGSLFLELLTKEDSETLIEGLIGKNYEKKEIKAVCVPESAYVDYYRKLWEKEGL